MDVARKTQRPKGRDGTDGATPDDRAIRERVARDVAEGEQIGKRHSQDDDPILKD